MARASLPDNSWGTIAVTATADGKYVASCRLKYAGFDAVKVRAQGKTGAAAKRALLTKVTAMIANPPRSKHELKTFEDAVRMWWQTKLDDKLKPNTYRRYDDALRLHLLPSLGSSPLEKLTVPVLETYLQGERKSGAASHVRLVKNVLSQVMAYATRQGAIPTNPVRDVSNVKSDKSDVKTLTLDEIQRLREAARLRTTTRLRSGGPIPTFPIELILDTLLGAGGLRIGEALALRWEDLDLDRPEPRITVRGTIVEIARGDEPWQIGLQRQDMPKTESSIRTVKIASWLIPALRAHPRSESGLVFATKSGTPYSRSNFYRAFTAVQKLAGLEGVRSHSYRKTVATEVAVDFDLAHASGSLGHSSTEITSRSYVKKASVAPDVRSTLNRLGPEGG